MRILTVAFPEAHEAWQPVVAGLAIATMVLGNLVALSQRSLKRMLAYSSIAHAGYLLTAVWAGTPLGAAATLLYRRLRTHHAGGVRHPGGAGPGRGAGGHARFDRGSGRRRPGSPFALAVCMLSCSDSPAPSGSGKWAILASVVEARQLPLAVILVVTSLISAGYYLPVIMAAYMREPGSADAHAEARLPRTAAATVGVAIAVVLVFGVLPSAALSSAVATAGTMVQSIAGPLAARALAAPSARRLW